MTKNSLTSIILGVSLFLSPVNSESGCLDNLLNFRCQPYSQQQKPKNSKPKEYPSSFIADETKKIIEKNTGFDDIEKKVYDLWDNIYQSIKKGKVSKEEQDWYSSLSDTEKKDFEDYISDDCLHSSGFMLRFSKEISMYHFEERDFIFFKRIIDSVEILSKNLNDDLHLFQNEPESDFGLDFKENSPGIKKEDLNEYFNQIYPPLEPFLELSTPHSKSLYNFNRNRNII